ncbi:MAG: VTT domain-containing protein [Rhizomicrobium sp.]
MIFGIHIGSSPETLALSILVSTFFLEDAAIGYAALLATTGMIAPHLAFAVLFLGIYVGDIGLYFLGAAARRFERARLFIGEGRIMTARKWLRHRSVLTLIGARVVPGSRLPIYAASGFLHLPFMTFASTTAAATLAWTGAIFSGIYAFGMHATELFGEFKYGAVAVVALIVIGGPFLSARLFARKTADA